MMRQPIGREVEFPCLVPLGCWGASLVVLEWYMQLNLISLVRDLRYCEIAPTLLTYCAGSNLQDSNVSMFSTEEELQE